MANMALAFDILARDRNASQTFDKIGRSAEHAGKAGGAFGSVIKKAMGVAAGALAAVKIVDFFKDANAEAREAQKVGALTASVIKATGGAAKVTANQVGDLATAISNKTGIDDEAIQSGANMLLTFKNIRNEVGKGNDIFNQSTKTLIDLASAMGTDPKQAAIQLGKALNDPVKGITALTRVGVTFTEGQKKQIKALVASGKTMEAQKIILKELNSEFGGAAEAQATAADKVSVAWGNFKEQIGTALLPTIDKLANLFSQKIIPALSTFFAALTGQSELNEFDGALKKINNAGVWLYETGQRLAKWVKKDLIPAFREAGQKILPGVHEAMEILTGSVGKSSGTWKKIGDVLTQKIIPVVATFVRYYLPAWATQIKLTIEAVKGLWKAASTLWSIWRTVMNALIRTFLNVVGAVVEGAAKAFGWVPGLGPKLKRAAEKFNDFRDSVNRALDGTRSEYELRVITPGMRQAINDVARLRWQIDHVPPSVTVGAFNKVQQMPGRALGGPVNAGRAYQVGERGPEVFVPSTAGRIVPAGGGGGYTRLHPHDIALLADALASRPTVLDGRQVSKSMDQALVLGVRP